MKNDKWLRHSLDYGACNVEKNYQFYFKFLLSKLHSLIKLENLPDSIDEVFVKNNLFLNGMVCGFLYNGELYILNGGYGGKPDAYYHPTEFIIANPVVGSHCLTIDKDCVVIYNDPTDKDFGGGLDQLLVTTATMLADNMVSINTAQINTRVQAIVTADSVAQKNSAEVALRKLYGGEPYQVLTNDLVSQIGVNPISSNKGASITELTELQQYILAAFYNSLGIKTNPYQKKERMITDEINSLDGYLGISLETIYNSWKNGFDRINEMFGTNIEVKLNPLFSNEVNVAEEGAIEVDDEIDVGETETIKEEDNSNEDCPAAVGNSNDKEDGGEEAKEEKDGDSE